MTSRAAHPKKHHHGGLPTKAAAARFAAEANGFAVEANGPPSAGRPDEGRDGERRRVRAAGRGRWASGFALEAK